jgi:hypothetical protein
VDLFIDWSWKQIYVFLALCGFASLISATCSAYSFRLHESDHPRAVDTRIRGSISLLITLLLWAGAAWACWKYVKIERPLEKAAYGGHYSPLSLACLGSPQLDRK